MLVDKNTSIHFGEDKTTSILFSKNTCWGLTFDNNKIIKYLIVEYLGRSLEANLSRNSMAMKPLKKINTKLQFLYIQNEFLNPKLRRLLCNSLIHAHLDYACIYWYPLVSHKIRRKIQVSQYKCTQFCFKLNSRHHIGVKEFKEIN